jgi:1-acyl-sn-glycerol-3-phosphate acyltransferase
MQTAPRRLKAKRLQLIPRVDGGVQDLPWPGSLVPTRASILRRVRAIRRGLFALIWTLLAMVVQGPLLLLPGRGKVGFARFYWTVMCRLIGLRVRVLGAAPQPGGRPVVFVSNHSSWLDILVLGGRLEACFISKDEVKGWPIINAVACLGRTVYVRRRRGSTGRERDDMRQRLAGGDNLILFPEGTTSDGSRVLPFRSAFLSIAELPAGTDGRPPLVQPVSVVYDRLGFLPTGRASRPLFAWYGDMSIGGHFWQLAQHRGLRATVLLHRPLDPTHFASRKALSQAAWRMVADGAATLRQNRPAQPGSPQENAASGAGSGGDGSAIEAISPDRPAFA